MARVQEMRVDAGCGVLVTWMEPKQLCDGTGQKPENQYPLHDEKGSGGPFHDVLCGEHLR